MLNNLSDALKSKEAAIQFGHVKKSAVNKLEIF